MRYSFGGAKAAGLREKVRGPTVGGMATLDDAMNELTYSGRRRREFLMTRWRAIILGSAVATAIGVGGALPYLWRLYHPELDLSNTAELELDAWARRRDLSLSWRACDDRDPDWDGWHLCRMSVGGAASVELWCAGDDRPERVGCTFEVRPVAPALRQPHGLGIMADPKNIPNQPNPATPQPTSPAPGGGGIAAPDPSLPPELGGGLAGGSHQGATPQNTGTGVREVDKDDRDQADRRRQR